MNSSESGRQPSIINLLWWGSSDYMLSAGTYTNHKSRDGL